MSKPAIDGGNKLLKHVIRLLRYKQPIAIFANIIAHAYCRQWLE